MSTLAAIYTRVSSDRQKEEHTIASQTAALIEYAQRHSYTVPPEWVFQDEGQSGATLLRPGLEALRDLAAQGQIQAILVYSPDRLSRKYAYQVVLAEEFVRLGVELVFLKSPTGTSPEDQLVVQFQGMIAEYERAQIAERCRRGKRHKAQQGIVNVLSAAPYGYRYVKKSETATAYYQVVEHEAEVVRMVFALYTRQQVGIDAIARHLQQQGIPTRKGRSHWDRSTLWGMLRNPAYVGKAGYGKSQVRPQQPGPLPLRPSKKFISRPRTQPRPRQDWLEIEVPALISQECFAQAQEQLQRNKLFSKRRTRRPTLLQGILICQQCGYAMYRSSGGNGQHRLYYYRCSGADGFRRRPGPVCSNRPVREEQLDQIVWEQIVALLEQETLIQAEIHRRCQSARTTDPRLRRKETLAQQQTRLSHQMDRLLTAYQEELLTLAQLRERMPGLKQQLKRVQSELQAMQEAAIEETQYLKLAESLSGFRSKLRARARTLDVTERQQILRLLVKEILVGPDTLTIRHSIPVSQTSASGSSTPPTASLPADYRLCPRSQVPTGLHGFAGQKSLVLPSNSSDFGDCGNSHGPSVLLHN